MKKNTHIQNIAMILHYISQSPSPAEPSIKLYFHRSQHFHRCHNQYHTPFFKAIRQNFYYNSFKELRIIKPLKWIERIFTRTCLCTFNQIEISWKRGSFLTSTVFSTQNDTSDCP